MPSEAPLSEAPPQTRRRWKRWAFGFLIILITFLTSANGPIFRWGLKEIIAQQLDTQQLTGTFKITGTALTGITIQDLSLTGESKIQSLESNLLKIDWSFSSLLKKELKALTLQKLHLVIDPEAHNLPPKENQAQAHTPEKNPLPDTLNLIRGFLQPAQISITDLNLIVKEKATISLHSLTHSADTSDYLLADLRTVDHLDRPIHNPNSVITWTTEGFAADKLSLLPKLALQNLIFHPEKRASTEIFIGKHLLTLTSDLATSHQLTLHSPDLPITTLIELAGQNIKTGGTITDLKIDTSTGSVNLKARDLQWKEQTFTSASIEASTKDLLSPFDQPVQIKIALDEQLAVSGTIIPDRVPLDSHANLDFTLRNPRIPTINGELRYDSRKIHLLASALDHLRIKAHYLVDTSTYEAEAISELKDASQLDPILTGPLDLNLTAKGSIKEKKHSGVLNLDRVQLNQPNLPEATTSSTITYNWPEKTTIQDLTMTSPEGQIQANLNWQNDLLTISQLDLIENGTKLFTATAQLPAPLKTQSLDDILNSTEPIHLTIKSQPLPLKKLSSFAPIPEKLSGVIIADLTLSGSLANPALDGFATLDTFRNSTQPDLPPIDLELKFKTQKNKLFFTANTAEPSGPLLKLDGNLPFQPRIWIESKTNPKEIPLNLHLFSPNLDLSRLTTITSSPEKLTGILKTDLTLSGSLAEPTLNGFINLDDFRSSTQPNLPPLDLNLNLETQNQQLLLTAKATEPGGPLLDIEGSLPFLPLAWLERKTNPNDSPINLRATSPDLDLRRAQPLSPFIKKITGNAQLDLLITGTISSPEYSGSAKIRIADMRIAESPISTIRNANLDATFHKETITLKSNNLSASGGTAKVNGTINLAGKEPIFDIHLHGTHVLLHRTQDYTFRGNTDLDLRGPYSTANISGSLQITESLLYKDVEILPFGISRTTEIPRPNIPTFSRKRTPKPTTQSDKGIMDWQLNIDISTADPILIRGNLARGEISGKTKVTGTIRDPKTSGTLIAKDLSVDLPFSNLKVQSGIITLRPQSLTNPFINLSGSSSVGQYEVQVHLTGPVQNPTLVLTSDPPLPESEIMLLLATGSASDQLEDRQVASQKALQYLFEGLRRRNRRKDKSILQRLLKNSDQIELSLGDTNQFSGRKFSSASLEINDQWDFTTQIDELGQTRALVVFSLRIK